MDKPSFLSAKNEAWRLLRESAGYHKSKHSELQFRTSPNKREMQFRESKEYQRHKKHKILFSRVCQWCTIFFIEGSNSIYKRLTYDKSEKKLEHLKRHQC
jgi:hypothetical protein